MDTKERKPLLSHSDGDVVCQHDVQKDYGIQSVDDPKVVPMKLYKRRWYILLLYSMFSGTQGTVWNTWGPIAASSEYAFGWTNSEISLLANWGPIAFVLSSVFFSWMLEVKGLRWACLTSLVLVTAGCGLRCITSTPPAVTWLIHVAQILNGFGAPLAMSGPPALSSAWFASNERTTSTALGFGISNTFMAASFIIGPLLVPDITNSSCPENYTSLSKSIPQELNTDTFNAPTAGNCGNDSQGGIVEERKHIMFLMYVEFGWALAILLLMVIYFPKKPPLPPCISASVPREDFVAGLKKLLTKKHFWLVCFVYGVAVGVINSWSSVMDVDLKDRGVGEKEAGWLGFIGVVGGCFFSLVVARLADIFSKHMRWILLTQYTIGAGLFTWFTLVCYGIAPKSTAVMYVTVVGGFTVVTSSVPLLFELGCELTYPVGEGTTNGILTLANNVGGLFLLFVLMIKNIGTQWMNWTVTGSVVVCLPVLFLLKDSYKRLEVDEITIHVDPEKD